MSLSIGSSLPLTPIALPAADGAKTAAGQRAVQLAGSEPVREAAAEAIRASAETQEPPAPPVRGVPPQIVAQVEVPAPKGGDGDTSNASVQVWDVNGDGRKDAVIRDEATGGVSALLNKGDAEAPKLEQAVNISAPTKDDLGKIAVTGSETGARFIAADLKGDGTRQLAVESGDKWLNLGVSHDAQLPLARTLAGEAVKTPIEQAEQTFLRLVGELSPILTAAAWDRPQGGADGRQYAGFLQMQQGNVDIDWMSANADVEDIGDMVMVDMFGGTSTAFGPMNVGLNLYLEGSQGEDEGEGAQGPAGGPATGGDRGPASALPGQADGRKAA